MEHELISNLEREFADKPLVKPVQTTESVPQQQENPHPPKKLRKKKALFFILTPLIFWTASYALALSADSDSDQFTWFDAVLQILALVYFLLSPVLLAMLIYGIAILIKAFIGTTENSNTPTQATEMPNYKVAIGVGVLGIVLMGWLGGGGGLASFPFLISGILTIFASIILFIITWFRRLAFVKNNKPKLPN